MQVAETCNLHENRLTFPALVGQTLIHAVFTRHGGVSKSPWNSLNSAFGVGDKRGHVRANRNIIKNSLALDIVVSAKQVHGDKVHCVNQRPKTDVEIDNCDALITDLAGVGIMIQHADCQAILLCDPTLKVTGIVHAGWRGSVANIIRSTISAMVDTYGVDPVNLVAAISPSLGPCCAEFINYQNELPKSFTKYQTKPHYFDFWAISRDQIMQTGVRQKNISTAGICTVCNPLFFSYRREKITGRCASVIAIRP